MPIYEYRCGSCGRVFEVIQKFSDDHLTLDPECGKGPVERLISAPSFQFKGTGFYVTDYAKGKDGGANSPPSATKGGGDSKPSDSPAAPDSKGDSKGSSPQESKATDNKSSDIKSSDTTASSAKTESKPTSQG